MSKYEVLAKSYINDRIYEIGDVVEIDNSVISDKKTGEHLRRVDAEKADKLLPNSTTDAQVAKAQDPRTLT